MSRTKVILITGANGEIGNNLINYFANSDNLNIISIDLQPMESSSKVKEHFIGSILDKNLLETINSQYEISEIYHLAAILSTKAEFSPIMAHNVNVNGTLNLLDLAIKQLTVSGRSVKFFFPSSIAVYSLKDKKYQSPVKEDEFLSPKTIYGMNKLYCEQLGYYFQNNYHQLAKNFQPGLLDFRSIRFPGLISVSTMPSGGTSDYIPEMLHAANNGENYTCFVDSASQLPFMVMPDAIDAIIKIMNVDKNNLNHYVYNIASFSPTVEEFYTNLIKYYNDFKISYKVSSKRQEMVNSWPSMVDCSNAIYDWDWKPMYTFDVVFNEYLIPKLKSIVS